MREDEAMDRVGSDNIRRQELASFLRSRRERLSPEDLGLPSYGRRRTPGLRREEVATVAGVGITWYTWLEQGRPITPSRSVLNALARTLLLDSHERRHLFSLADVKTDEGSSCRDVSSPIRALLTQMDPLPAAAQNARFDVLALNRGYAWLFPEVAAEPEETRNFPRLLFTVPSLRARIADDAVVRLVATFRGAMAEHLTSPAFKELLAELLERSPEFAELWGRHDVRLPENTQKQFRHDAGLLHFQHTYLWPAQRGGTRVIALLPSDEFTRDTLDLAVGRAPVTPLAIGADDVAAAFASA